MLQPIVGESNWLAALRDLPEWQVPARPLLIIAPHPDDETLGAGGLIASHRAKGLDVVVAAVTDGEKAFPGVAGLAAARREEQTQALSRLGVPAGKIVRLGLPDGGVPHREEELYEKLKPLVLEQTLIVVPWKGDFHPDHEACGRVGERLAAETSATVVSYFFWTWHYGTQHALENLPLRCFPLSPELLRAKSEALLSYDSQLGDQWGEPVLPELLLLPARRSFEVFVVE